MVAYTNYSYYDTPDGEDFTKKLYYLERYGLTAGSYMAVTDCLFVTKPVGFAPMLDRFIRVFSRPLIGVFIFESSVYMATKLRRKDDGWNHVIGCGAMFAFGHRYIQNPLLTWYTGIFTAVTLYFFKEYKMMYGYHYFHDMYNAREDVCMSVFSRYNNWSWRKKMPREWLRADEVEAQNVKN